MRDTLPPVPTQLEFYVSPKDVVADPTATVEEKRALLASWASDARAVRDAPALRQLDSGAIVFIDDVLSALKQLDDIDAQLGTRSTGIRRSARTLRNFRLYRRAYRDGDDDGPSPSPAIARPPKPLPSLGTEAVAA
jgi:hypothetical protein